MKLIPIIFLLLTATSSVAEQVKEDEYSFDYKNEKDMRNAWQMCAFNTFNGDHCKKVYKKCHKPPMIKMKYGKWVTICDKPVKMKWTQNDTDRALTEADKRATGGESSTPNENNTPPPALTEEQRRRRERKPD